MKKIILPALAAVFVVTVGGYFLYESLVSNIIAEVVTTKSLPDYIPKRIQSRIQGISAPINEGAEAMLDQMHTAGIPIEKILAVIDATTEEQVYALVDELNSTRPQTTDEDFTIGIKHIATDFDPEVFRKAFNDNVNMKQIRKALFYADQNRKTHDLDFATTKAIAKKILLQKEKEYYSAQDN